SDFSSCKCRKKRKPPIILASLGCFFAHRSYSLRTARFASSFFTLATQTPFPMQHAVKRGAAAVTVFFPMQINDGGRVSLTKFVPGFLGTLSLKDLSTPFVTKWRRMLNAITFD